MNYQKPTPKKEVCLPRFLAAYAQSGNIGAACEIAGIDRHTFYKWRRDEPDFEEALTVAREAATERLEMIAQARAEESSDTLMIFLLKGLNPAKYRDNHRHEVANPEGEGFKVYLFPKEDG